MNIKTFLSLTLIAMFALCACAAPGSPANPSGSSPAVAPTASAVTTTANDCPPTLEEALTAVLNMTEEELKAFAEKCGDVAESTTTTSSNWTTTYYKGADLDRGDGTTFRSTAEKWKFREVAPELWPTFPNVPNPLVKDFRVVNGNEVPDGLEYAMDESNFCQQNEGETCRFPVAAQHYFSYTGDYKFLQFEGKAENGVGDNLIVINVGKVTSDFTARFDQGFRLHARYWNGDKLDMAIWALASHNANVMMNLDSALNPNNVTNAGANCSIPEGCKGVKITVVFVSGNELLMSMTTVVKK